MPGHPSLETIAVHARPERPEAMMNHVDTMPLDNEIKLAPLLGFEGIGECAIHLGKRAEYFFQYL
jgi:hypothetical protein